MTILKNSKKFKLLFEIVYVLIHNPPYANFALSFSQQGFPISYNIDVIINLIMQFRALYWLRINIITSFYNSLKTKELCQQYNAEFTMNFILRCILKAGPYPIVVGWLSISTIVCGFSIRQFELTYMHVSGQNWTEVWNGYWNVVVTLSSVGYGDLFASTHSGRLVAVCVMFWGVFITSMILVAMNITSQMTRQESYVPLQFPNFYPIGVR